MGLPASAMGQRTPGVLAVPPPVPPAVRLLLRVRARILAPDDFDALHGRERRACFVTVHDDPVIAEPGAQAPRIDDVQGASHALVPPSADAIARQHHHAVLSGLLDPSAMQAARLVSVREAAAESRGSSGGVLGLVSRDLLEMLADLDLDAPITSEFGRTFADVIGQMRAPVSGDAPSGGHLGGDSAVATGGCEVATGGCEDRAWSLCHTDGRAMAAGVMESLLRLVIGDAMGSADAAGAFLAEGGDAGDGGDGWLPLAGRAVILDG